MAAERQRLQEIDQIASLFADELVQEAKYGENPCNANELAYRAAVAAAQQGRAFMESLEADAAASGAAKVGASPASGAEDKPMTNADKVAAGEAMAKKLAGN